MHTNYVDRILAQLDGAIAPIWISVVMKFDFCIDMDLLKKSTYSLIKETLRLNLVWDERHKRWISCSRDYEDASKIIKIIDKDCPIDALFNQPIDIHKDIPLCIYLMPLSTDCATHNLLVVQLHHAIGDGQSIMMLNRRLWQHYFGIATSDNSLAEFPVTDWDLLMGAFKHPSCLLNLLNPRYRLFAQRGLVLKKDASHPSCPILVSIRVSLDNKMPKRKGVALFYGALLAAIVKHEELTANDELLRFRVPVNLRSELGHRHTLENCDSALPVEIPLCLIRKYVDTPETLCKLIPKEISLLLKKKVQWSTLIESLVTSRILTQNKLREMAKTDFMVRHRSNTMLVTYSGAIDSYASSLPFEIQSVQCQPTTWGVNGYTLGNHLYINVTCFKGIWNTDTMKAFAGFMLDWLKTHFQLEGEYLPS